MLTPSIPHRIRSFVRRSGRKTIAQERARENMWPVVGLDTADGLIHFPQVFGRDAPRIMEIGFGTGQSLLALANERPDLDMIGVETYKAGIGALLLGIQQRELTNIRVYDADVIDVLAACIPAESLDGVQIFFPDPWQKRRHHARRLIQPEFVARVVEKLKPHGTLHLATDWEDYATHMCCVLSQENCLMNIAGERQFASRSPFRPILSKFERRALREGRGIWELQFKKV